MKAIRIHAFGGPDVLSYEEVPDPEPGPGEVVVDIKATSVNPADWKVREGQYRDAPWLRLPHIPGRDLSGTVRSVGTGVEDFAPGDAVFGVTDQGQEGAYAEAIAIAAAIVAPRPASLSDAEAAAMALGALTALVALEDTARLKPGETILIQGGAGGVGAMAVQIAKNLGATVIATARGANVDYVKGLGADRVIDYEAEDFVHAAPPCDVVFDTVGGDVQVRSCEVLKPAGRLVWIARGPEGFKAPDHVTLLRPDVKRDRPHFERITEMIATGALKAPEITVLPLADAARAQEMRRTRAVRGKVVLMMG